MEQARVYIRPAQADIMDICGNVLESVEPEKQEKEPQEKCLICGKEVDLSFLSTHVECCREGRKLSLQMKREEELKATPSPPPIPPPAPPLPTDKNGDNSVCPCSSPLLIPPALPLPTDRVGDNSLHDSIGAPPIPPPEPPLPTDRDSDDNLPAQWQYQDSRLAPTGYSAYVGLFEQEFPEGFGENEVQMAIQASLNDSKDKLELNTSEILEQHVSNLGLLCGPDDPHQMVTVRRKHIWKDIKRCFSKAYTRVSLPLRIHFVGESAADEGGPKREFFRLGLAACCNDPSLFTGSQYARIPLHNSSALLQKQYKYVGYMMAMSIVQGGPGPMCLAKWVYQYWTQGLEDVNIEIEDIPIDNVKVFLQQVSQITDVGKLRDLLMEDTASVVFECGFSKPISKVELEDIPTLKKAIVIHTCIIPIKAELDQLREGLGLFNIDQLITTFPEKMEVLFVLSGQPEQISLVEFLQLIEYDYSESGSNQREREEQATVNWIEFLEELEHRVAECTICSVDGEEEIRKITIEDVIVFATGANRVPPMGFPKKVTIDFDQTNKENYPKASTCSLTMYLPTRWPAYQDFKREMIEGIVSGFGFGQA